MKTFLQLVNVQSKMLAYNSQCGEYESWSDEFCGKEVRDTLKQWFTMLKTEKINWESFSIEQLEALGFGWWSEEKNLLLIPLHFRLAFYTKNIPDNDQRFGCLAYGFPVKDGKVDFSSEKGIE